jgi:hypothetical protein
MGNPGLKMLYKREILVAPKTAFAIAGCPEQQGALADDMRDRAKLTSFVPNLAAIDALLGVLLTSINLKCALSETAS